ncbi:hypothetical protein IAQ61_002744 [Plenodomus lingam]|uniref:uncharacterized protein n=1 Tax=Leptosphaeria maculans TaxID=5022 RepID=UPI0033329F6C|nr:hypothetical protein IAQ61_002744 [Plenodomus lingam]
MSTSMGALPTMVVAAIAVGGIFGLCGLVVVIAVLLDWPNRKQRRQNKGIMEELREERQAGNVDVEKGKADVTEAEVSSTKPPTYYSSVRTTGTTSLQGHYEHPVVANNPPRI